LATRIRSRFSFSVVSVTDQGQSIRTTLIYNPTAGDEDQDGRSLRSLLEAAGHDVRAASVKADGWQELLAEPVELVVVAGGDGTVRKVFKELATSGLDATILPAGSANNIARTLRLVGKPLEELIDGWPDGVRLPYHLGEASAPWGQTYVVESFGAGLFAEVLRRADDDVEGAGDKLELGLQVLGEVLEESPVFECELDVDGNGASGELLAAEAMNIRETGPNVPLARGADPADGLLDVVLIRPEDRAPLLDYIHARLRGEQPEAPQLTVLRGSRVTVNAPPDCPLRVDDELWPADPSARTADPVEVTMGAVAVNVVVPAE
jgi:diacylglycerol kinase (ATP)